MSAPAVRTEWSRTTKVIVIVALVLALLALAIVLREIIAPLLLAGILAYLLTPLSSFFEAHLHLGRGWATGLVYLLLLVALAVALGVLIPIVVEQLTNLNLDAQSTIDRVAVLLGRPVVLAGVKVDLAQVLAQATRALSGVLEPVFGRTLGIAFDLLSSVLWVVFIVVVSFYFVRDRARLQQAYDSMWPSAVREEGVRLRQDVDAVWRAFFIGQVLLALVVTVLFAVIGVVVGLPFPLVMAVLAGLLEFLPSLGHGLWMLTAGLLMLIHGSSWLPIPPWAAAALIVAIHLVFQQVDLNYLIPRLVGRRVRLHPAVVIVGVFAGAIAAGVLGVVLAAPMIASARVLGTFLRSHLYDVGDGRDLAHETA
ncbi:MAG TPA: AI-2E family transporter [Anaerolineales bacterium]|nr:AI-2E family transporter [Anaerolineales bacterium]